MTYFTRALWSIAVLLSIGCKQVLIMVEGIKQPVLENHASLSKFLLNYGIDTSEILCFRDTVSLNDFYKADIGIPDSRFFNRQKEMVDYRSSPSDCNGKVSLFLEKMDTINTKSPVKGKVLDDFLKSVVIERTGQNFRLEDRHYDVYMIVYWAKYAGRINKHKVFEWQKLVEKATREGKSARMILVNADYQSIWGIRKNQVPKFDF